MSTQKTISISRALAELKLYDSKINNNISKLKVISLEYNGRPSEVGVTSEAFLSDALSGYKSVIDLIANRYVLKAAIVSSNSSTFVVVNDVKMTVAAAIERKSSVDYLKKLLFNMQSQYSAVNSIYEREKINIQQRLDTLLNQTAGKDRKVTGEDNKEISDAFIKSNTPKILDPLSIVEKIKKLELDILNFNSEVDIVLSESNARTEIVVKLN